MTKAEKAVIDYIVKKNTKAIYGIKAEVMIQALQSLKENGIIYYGYREPKLTKKGWDLTLVKPPEGEDLNYWTTIIINVELGLVKGMEKLEYYQKTMLGKDKPADVDSIKKYVKYLTAIITPCTLFEIIYDELIGSGQRGTLKYWTTMTRAG